jgi:uncharacterized membrane protein HdeD (DUF308 family)
MTTQASTLKMELPHIHWGLILLEGIAAFIVGVLILVEPGISTLALTQLLGAYWLVSGVFSLVSIFSSRRSWGWKLLAGILGVIAGLTVFQYPLWSAILVPAVVGAILGMTGILIGVMRLVMSYRGAGVGIAILGAMSILLGFVLLLFPPLAILTAIYMFAFLSLLGGISAFIAALSLRRGKAVNVVPAPTPVAPAPVLIPVTGKAPEEPQPETEHEGEETGEYTGESGNNTSAGQIPVTGQGMPESQAGSGHKNEESRKYPGDDEYGEEM